MKLKNHRLKPGGVSAQSWLVRISHAIEEPPAEAWWCRSVKLVGADSARKLKDHRLKPGGVSA